MHAVMSRIQLVCVLLFLGSLHAPSVIAANGRDREVRSPKDEILALTNQLIDAFVTNDSDAEMDMWHPEAYLATEGIPLAHGKEAIRNAEKLVGPPLHRLEQEYIEVQPNEEGADYVYVLLSVKWYDSEEKVVTDKNCLLVWRNTEGGYKAAMLMITSNM